MVDVMANAVPEAVSTARCFGGTQLVFRHRSEITGTDMRFAAFVFRRRVLRSCRSCGLRWADLHGGELHRAWRPARRCRTGTDPSPHTPPLVARVYRTDGAYDFGLGAFYLDATQEPWARHYRMESYIIRELPEIGPHVAGRPERQGIMGHSYGGHGALTLALRHPNRFASVSRRSLRR